MNPEIGSRTMPFTPQSNEQNEGSWEFIAFAWRRKWIVVLLSLVGLALGYLYFLRLTPIYQSTAQVLLVQRKEKLPFQGLEMSTGYDTTHEILMCSPIVVSIALNSDENLRSLPSFAGNPNPVATIISGLTVSTTSRGQTSGDIFDLSYTSVSSQDCPVVLQAVVNAYRKFLGDTYQSVSNEAVDLIKKARDELDTQITESREAYAKFRQRSSLLYAGQSALNVHEVRLKEIENIRSAAFLQNSQFKAQIEGLQKALDEGANRLALTMALEQLQHIGPQTMSSVEGVTKHDDPLFPNMMEEQMLLQRYGPDHPKVQEVRKRLEILRERLTESTGPEEATEAPAFIQTYLVSLRERMKMNDKTIAEMDQLFKEENEAAGRLAADQLEDETLRADIDRRHRMYEAVIKRLEEINLVKDSDTAKVELINGPSRGSQVAPDLTRVVLSGTLLGAVAGLGLAFLVDRADRRFRSPEEIRQDLCLPVVGHIPVIPATGNNQGALNAESGLPANCSPSLLSAHRPRGRIAEAYRAVRTAMYFSTRGRGHQVVQITSPSPGDGKTTLAGNLAISIACSGKRTLILDADFRRPRIHRVFGIENSSGVTSVLDGTAELSDVICPSGIENLDLLPCGQRPANPSELITSKRFEELLSVLREKYEFVVVDTPPVLAVTDPLNVVPRVDGVLLVMRLSKSARAASRRARELLDEIGANMLGIVVNGVGGNPGYGDYGSKYAYGGYRAYGYGYHYSDDYRDRYRYGYSDDTTYYEDADKEAPEKALANGNGKAKPAQNGKA